MSLKNAIFLAIFILMSTENFMLSRVEQEKSFITSGGFIKLGMQSSYTPYNPFVMIRYTLCIIFRMIQIHVYKI